MVALTGVERAKGQFSLVQLGPPDARSSVLPDDVHATRPWIAPRQEPSLSATKSSWMLSRSGSSSVGEFIGGAGARMRNPARGSKYNTVVEAPEPHSAGLSLRQGWKRRSEAIDFRVASRLLRVTQPTAMASLRCTMGPRDSTRPFCVASIRACRN
jgi:hypothetical protein